MDIRLIAADLDGTLLDEKKNVSKRNLDALHRAAQKGILFVPATGRIWTALPQPILDLPFLKYAITVNGAGVADCVEDRILYKAEIPNERAIQLCEYMRQVGTHYDCYMDGRGYMDQYYYDRIDEFCRENFRDLVRRTRKPVPDLVEFLKTQGDVQKVQMFFNDMELREHIMKDLPEKFPDMAVTTSVVNNIEVNAADGNKGNALCILCTHLGIDMSQVAAFGDGINDITMLEAAGVSVAMGNAGEEVKQAARYVTLTNEEDGVADFLEKYVL